MINPKCVTRGGGGPKKPQNLRDVIYGWSLAQKPPSENCHLGREGALRTLAASGYVAHLQSLVETVLKDATHVAPSVREVLARSIMQRQALHALFGSDHPPHDGTN